jgi:hypothetical protein
MMRNCEVNDDRQAIVPTPASVPVNRFEWLLPVPW